MEGNVSNHLGVRNNTNEEVNRTKFGQSDERTVYEVQHGTQPNHGDYCSITIDDGGGLDNEMLQQRIHSVYRQREDLHNMEVELRAQIMARSAIVEMKNSFDVQMKEHVNAYEELKEQLEERESIIHEMELQMEEKDRELRAITIDNEAAWAKEDLLREQNKELASFRLLSEILGGAVRPPLFHLLWQNRRLLHYNTLTRTWTEIWGTLPWETSKVAIIPQ